MKTEKRNNILLKIQAIEKQLNLANRELEEFDASLENNTFDTLEEATDTLEDVLYGMARADCEGSYNCGSPEYTREFMVGDVKYLAKLEVEYDRHDKTYYYIYGRKFSYSAI